ncbi:MAG: hypothetical protein ACK5RV_07775 [Flavobacterium sp.]|jgi:hypothetical protein|uniref:hypothetical protein n=1 Tax=Flavobacterium sp. TaxID=239 RepID=UPI0022C7EFDF|nr:hypothetical protein [Flavobacterium sp.]MCZ8169632.1 hypothetical protein [Flavobacterium sp.]MCZ8296473.1 hypothetical protein [Flavobacterium sp.]
MRKIWLLYKNTPALLLILLSFGIGLLSKLVEGHFTDIAMGMQLIAFFFLLSGLIRFFDRVLFKTK